MTITVWDVFHDSVFQQGDPQICAGSAGMNGAVRWVYTHERYDVTEFLSGGEMLIIEGSTLVEHADDKELSAYVDALSQAGVSALVMELVDFFTEVPAALTRRADELSLPVIGLHTRVPFVALCQEINTAIAREQLMAHVQVDNLSTALASSFSSASSVTDIARSLCSTLGEHVLIVAADGALLASEGLGTGEHHGGGRSDIPQNRIFRVPAADGMPVATVIISQRMTVMDERTRQCIATLLAHALPPFVTLDIKARLQMRILQGAARSGKRPSMEETFQTHNMLRAIGLLDDMRALPFAVRIRHWEDDAQTLKSCIAHAEDAMIPGRTSLIVTLEGDLLVGAVLSDDASWFPSMTAYGHDVLRAIAEVGCDAVQIIEGAPASDAADLLEAIAAVRFAAQSVVDRPSRVHAQAGPEPQGQSPIIPVNAIAYRRLLSIPSTMDAAHAFVAQVAGSLVDADDVLIDTLCMLSDCMGSKTLACDWLGVQRQTLYNRLERVERLTGISQRDTVSWSAMLVGAKLIHEMRAAD